MARQLKVWGTCVFIGSMQVRAVVATETKKKAAEMFKITPAVFRAYACQTFNKVELTVALSKPGALFINELMFSPREENYVEIDSDSHQGR